jgi:PII-like signaling protein
MPDLSLQKKAQRLRIYIGESDRWRSKALDAALLETLRAKGMAGATIFRGVAGFGAHSRIHTTSIEVLSFDLPIVIEVVDTQDNIEAILDHLPHGARRVDHRRRCRDRQIHPSFSQSSSNRPVGVGSDDTRCG